jgi:hypothetical protein
VKPVAFRTWLKIRIICSRNLEKPMINMLSNRLKIDVLKIRFSFYPCKLKILDFKTRECNNNKPMPTQAEFLWHIKRPEHRDHQVAQLKIWLVQLDKRVTMELLKEMNLLLKRLISAKRLMAFSKQ